MSDEKDKSSQTEEPTQKRLSAAADNSDIVKSQEVSNFVMLGAGTLGSATFGRQAAESLAAIMRMFLEQPDQLGVAGSDLMAMFQTLLLRVAGILAPFFLLMVGAGLGGNLIQHRPMLTFERIKPDFSKLSLLSGLKRMFGMDGLSNLAKCL